MRLKISVTNMLVAPFAQVSGLAEDVAFSHCASATSHMQYNVQCAGYDWQQTMPFFEAKLVLRQREEWKQRLAATGRGE
jgi:hypothetical protein